MTQSARINQGDLWSGGVLAGLGVYIILQAKDWDYLTLEGPGPGFFPIWYGVAMVLLSLGLVISRLMRREARGEPVDWSEVARAMAAWTVFAVAVALLKILGFLFAFALLSLYVACVMYRRPLRTGVAIGAIGAAVFYLVFPLGLGVMLPVGVLGF